KKLEQILYSIEEYLFGMGKNVPITEIVSKSKITVTTQDRISSVYQLMKRLQLKHIPVTDADKVVGIISRRDILHLGFGYEYDGRKDVELGMFDMLQADQVMVKNQTLVSPESTVEEVAELLLKAGMLALPVVVADGNVTGTVDIYDVMLALLR